MSSAALDQPTETSNQDAETMRAVVQRRYGTSAAEVLDVAVVPRPVGGGDQVLVRVVAASVDYGTWHCMSGLPAAMRLAGFGVRAPKASNPGRAFAGVVDAMGGTATGFAVGDEVYGTCDGAFAEYVAVDVDHLARKPENLTFEQAAAAPISGVTALQAVWAAGVQRGQRVLVIGASGGVGSFAVQIAKAAGAEVTGVCSTSKVDLVRSIGADHVIDYLRDDIGSKGERYDAIIDIAGNRRIGTLRRALTPKGTLVIVGGETDGLIFGGFGRSLRAVALSPFVTQRLRMLASTENATDLVKLGDLIEAGEVMPVVNGTYPLEGVGAAIGHVKDGLSRGKVVVSIGAR